MPYGPDHRAKTRARIIKSAQELFNRRGFVGVSIDEIMSHAGLTRGGFYSYFRAKSDLYAEAVTPWSNWEGAGGDLSPREVAQRVIDAYLSREHFDDVEGSCPMVTLAGDVARCDQVVKRAFERVFLGMAKVFDEALQSEGRPNGNLALSMAGICVGAMAVSRSVDSSELADAIRAAARLTTLDLAGWGAQSMVRSLPAGEATTKE